MDPIVVVIVIALGMPLAVLAALAISARLRGPVTHREPRRRVDSLVTDVIADGRREGDEGRDSGPQLTIDSPPPEPDPGLRGRESGAGT